MSNDSRGTNSLFRIWVIVEDVPGIFRRRGTDRGIERSPGMGFQYIIRLIKGRLGKYGGRDFRHLYKGLYRFY